MSAAESAPHSPARLPVVDALRGVAALAVLFFHSLAAFDSPASLHPVLRGIQRLTEHGHLGVSVFFALSGWCIAQRLQSAWRSRETAGHFLGDRCLRIYPTYWAALLAALALRLLAVPFRDTTLSANLPAGPHAWLADVLLLQPYFNTAPYLLVSWTLVFEIGFYVAATFGLGARQLGARTVWLVVAGLLACVPIDPDLHFPGSFLWHRWPDFFSGAFAWWIAHRTTGRARLAWTTLLLAVGLASPVGPADPVRWTAVTTALLLLVCVGRSASARGAWLQPLAWVGAFSYSLYLIHTPVMSPFMNLAGRFVSSTSLLFVGVWAASLVIALAAGWLLYRGVEQPAEGWRRRLAVRPARA